MFGDLGNLGSLGQLGESMSFNEVEIRNSNPDYSYGYGIPEEQWMEGPPVQGPAALSATATRPPLLERSETILGYELTVKDILLYGVLGAGAYLLYTGGLGSGTAPRTLPVRANRKRKRKSRRRRRNRK